MYCPGPMHPNTDFDPALIAKALVRQLEVEALDEAQVMDALSIIASVLDARRTVAMQRCSAQLQARTDDSRRELVRAKVKGVQPAAERSPLLTGAEALRALPPPTKVG